MSWEDRQQGLAYTSPKGKRFTPDFEDLEQSFDKKTERTDYAAADVTLVRDFGHTARTFPLAVYFSGPDCDKDAAAFLNGIRERGFGRLEHPLEGLFYVVPTGTVSRRDDLATAANVVALEIEFQETNDIATAPAARAVTAASAVAVAVESAQEKIAAEAAGDMVGSGVTATASLAAEAEKNTKDMLSKLTAAIQGQEVKVRTGLLARVAALENNISYLAETPAALASTILLSAQSIITAPERIWDRLSGTYGALAGLLAATVGYSADGADAVAVYSARRTQAAAYILGAAEAVAAEPWERREDAVAAAVTLQAATGAYLRWTEQAAAALDTPNANGSDSDIQEAAALAAGGVVARSFDLTLEYRRTLDRARAVVDLVAEVYQDLGRVDDFITSNNLTGSEILELPRGRQIVYYL